MDNKQNLRNPFFDLFASVIIGAEEEEGGAPKPTPPVSQENPSTEDDSKPEAKGQEHDDADDPKIQGLKSALEKERADARANAKELAKLRKDQEARELADKTELEKLQITAKKDQERAQKLSDGYLLKSINDAIRGAATAFIDAEDAIESVDRSKIVFEQDEEDPSIVTIDEKSVAAAVKDLATKRPRYLKSGTEDGLETGSQFGGSKNQKKADVDAEMRKKYPALGR